MEVLHIGSQFCGRTLRPSKDSAGGRISKPWSRTYNTPAWFGFGYDFLLLLTAAWLGPVYNERLDFKRPCLLAPPRGGAKWHGWGWALDSVGVSLVALGIE